jgi:flagellar FliL protein
MSEAVIENPEGAEEGAPKKKSKLPLILVAVVLAGAAGGGWFFMSKGKGEGEAATAREAPPAPAIYVSFEPPFVVNFESGGLVRFLQVAIQVMTRDPHVAEELKLHDPVIRNDLLLLLGNQKYETISTREGKEALQHQALEAIRHIVKANGGEAESVDSVLFTSFVMQ